METAPGSDFSAIRPGSDIDELQRRAGLEGSDNLLASLD